jgi:hypothetical protein
MTIFYYLKFETSPPPNLEIHVPVFISPRNREHQLYPEEREREREKKVVGW